MADKHPHEPGDDRGVSSLADVYLNTVPGVRMALPAPEHIGPITAAIDRFATATLKPGESGGLVTVLTVNSAGAVNANLAIVHRVSDRNTVLAWIGKEGSWGSPVEAGFAWRKTWP